METVTITAARAIVMIFADLARIDFIGLVLSGWWFGLLVTRHPSDSVPKFMRYTGKNPKAGKLGKIL